MTLPDLDSTELILFDVKYLYWKIKLGAIQQCREALQSNSECYGWESNISHRCNEMSERYTLSLYNLITALIYCRWPCFFAHTVVPLFLQRNWRWIRFFSAIRTGFVPLLAIDCDLDHSNTIHRLSFALTSSVTLLRFMRCDLKTGVEPSLWTVGQWPWDAPRHSEADWSVLE